MYFTCYDDYQSFLNFLPNFLTILSPVFSILVNSYKRVTRQKSAKIPPEKNKPFYSDLVPIMYNLVNGRRKHKISQLSLNATKCFFIVCSNFKLNLYIVYESKSKSMAA